MKTIAYKLNPRSPFHIGERGIGIEETAEIIHSDTLFSAIVSAWRALGEDVDELLKPFDPDVSNKPPFKLSSAFPFANDVLFFPVPLTWLGGDKKVKKTKFISKGVLLKGKLDDSIKEIQNEKLRCTSDEGKTMPKKLWEEDYVPRVSIDRISSASNIFHCGKIMFTESCGLYFLVDIIDEKYKLYLDKAIDYLGDSGIGGERSTGHGQFSYCEKEIDLPTNNGNKFMTLSLYHPTKDEVDSGILDDARYNLIKRGGWIGSPDGNSQRRRSVMMIAEGALFSKSVNGDIVDVKPKDWEYHPIYRYGIAFNLPIGEEVQKNG